MRQPDDAEANALLSADRLAGYRLKSGRNTDRDLLGRYMQNVAVSQALYPYLHAVEVVLRNRIFAAVAEDQPIHRDRLDLYNDFPCWLDAKLPILIDNHQEVVVNAKQDVQKDLRRALPQSTEPGISPVDSWPPRCEAAVQLLGLPVRQ
ncbi:hypothetical protein [Longimicrobium sp.]|uniref:hypothetical protein n=1 Tax=Longimicrobium sp. TaxID=2029185 RepID=UPI003B3A4929